MYLPSQFVPRLLEWDAEDNPRGYWYAQVADWTADIEVHDFEVIYSSVPTKHHYWTAAVIDQRTPAIEYLDHIYGDQSGSEIISAFRQWYEDEHVFQKHGMPEELDIDLLKLGHQRCLGVIGDTVDSGIATLANAFLLAMGDEIADEVDCQFYRQLFAIGLVEGGFVLGGDLVEGQAAPLVVSRERRFFRFEDIPLPVVQNCGEVLMSLAPAEIELLERDVDVRTYIRSVNPRSSVVLGMDNFQAKEVVDALVSVRKSLHSVSP